MKYRVALASTAKAAIHGQARWLRDEVSPTSAEKWLTGLYKAIEYDLIVLTQSCDLVQRKVRLLASCPIFPLPEFEDERHAGGTRGGVDWNDFPP
jgi:sensor domain CHASE-containing protein